MSNEFGLTKEQHEKLDMPSNEKTMHWLRESRAKEKNLKFKNGIKGLPLTHYAQISEKLRGIQPGLHSIIAKSNIGKSTLLTSLCADLIQTAYKNEDNLKVVFYTFDDDMDYMRHMLVSFMSNVHKNRVDCYNDRSLEQDSIDLTYRFLEILAQENKFVMKGVEEISNIDELMNDIENERDNFSGKFCVFIDGQSNLDTDIPRIREANIYKANEMKKMASRRRIPIILTLEVPKLTGRWRPEKEDVMESVKYTFNSMSIIALSPVDDETEQGDGYPVIMMNFVKNKYSGFKKSLSAYRVGQKAHFRMATNEEHETNKSRATEFDYKSLRQKK